MLHRKAIKYVCTRTGKTKLGVSGTLQRRKYIELHSRRIDISLAREQQRTLSKVILSPYLNGAHNGSSRNAIIFTLQHNTHKLGCRWVPTHRTVYTTFQGKLVYWQVYDAHHKMRLWLKNIEWALDTSMETKQGQCWNIQIMKFS